MGLRSGLPAGGPWKGSRAICPPATSRPSRRLTRSSAERSRRSCTRPSRRRRARGWPHEWRVQGSALSAPRLRMRDEVATTRLNVHPTVKPIEVMRWLIRLACPEGGTVLDPFMGSGTTGCAAVEEGRHFVGIELDEEEGYRRHRRRAHHGLGEEGGSVTRTRRRTDAVRGAGSDASRSSRSLPTRPKSCLGRLDADGSTGARIPFPAAQRHAEARGVSRAEVVRRLLERARGPSSGLSRARGAARLRGRCW